MASFMSRKDLEEIKPRIERVVEKVLGHTDSKMECIIMGCIAAGYDSKKTHEKLCTLVELEKAAKLTGRIFEAVARTLNPRSSKVSSLSSDKRSSEVYENGDSKRLKHEKNGSDHIASTPKINSTLLSDTQIKDMMVNAQKMIEERKKALSALKTATPVQNKNSGDKIVQSEKQRKIEQLQSQIQSKIASGLLKTVGAAPIIMTATDKPAPLILDSEGRTVDVTGKEVQLTHVAPTLKANIRARKQEEFKQQFQEKTVDDMTESTFFDPRISAKSNIRNKRALKFNEPGKFQQLAERMRMKAQLEKLQNEISQIAKRTGISSATKLAQIAPKEEAQLDEIPDVEWWDSVILNEESYYGVENDEEEAIKITSITNLVEHPTQMRAPTDPMKPVLMSVFLTKTERKKMRRQNRREAWKEEQEKIRLGLEPPPEPKLRISNLMTVLGSEAVQDPTKMEAHVRAQMAKRQKAHEEANANRKLTPQQKREKKVHKITEDTSLGVNVSVYRINDLSSPSIKFKIEKNAQQLFMTGGVIMFHDCNIVVVEGGPKQQKKYKRLMLHRIKWEEDMGKGKEGKGKEGKGVPNKCTLVWEGMTKQRNFSEMKFKVCATEKLAREQLKKHGVEQYWDLAYSKSILDVPDDK